MKAEDAVALVKGVGAALGGALIFLALALYIANSTGVDLSKPVNDFLGKYTSALVILILAGAAATILPMFGIGKKGE